jgi:hypothetical protein
MAPPLSELLVFLALLAAPSAPLPPPPGSTPEFKAANEAHLLATWTPVMAVSAEQAEKNRRTSAEAWPKVLRLMPAACAKDDAAACEAIALSESLFLKLPDPRAARQQAAAKASALYGQLCSANPDGGYAYCRRWQEFLKNLETRDASNPRVATTVLPGAWRALAGHYDTRCRAATGEAYSIAGDCETALKLHEASAPDQQRALREHLCGRDHAPSCHKAGRMSAKERAKTDAAAAQCNAGAVEGCRTMAAHWAYAEWSPGFGEQARTWARKGCELNDASACMMYGETLLVSKYGTPDPAAAAAAYAKVCRMPAGSDQKRSCESEAKIRDWMSKNPR